ncbi:MAG TPA: hypothetical protein VK787_10085 [Puia sp.]|nr:hypothetical protein [Puia sp.]
MGTNKRDIVLNVNFKDALIRFGITLLLPVLALIIDSRLIIYMAPAMAYLFVSAIIHFCIFKYLWHRYIRNEPTPSRKPYGEDPNYPEESI